MKAAALPPMIGQLSSNGRVLVQMAADQIAWVAGLSFAMAARYDFSPHRLAHAGLLAIAVFACGMQVALGVVDGLYRRRWRFGSFEEVASLAGTTLLAAGAAFVFNLTTGPLHWVPASVPLGGGVAALVLMLGLRYLWRLYLDRRLRPSGERCARVLVFGAGDGGSQVVASMLRDPDSPYLPVAFLDDDPAKRRLSIMGVKVVGDRSALGAAATHHRAKALLIAIPTADAELVRTLARLGREAGLDVTVLPSVTELLDSSVDVVDIRTPTMADLLGRREIDTDVASIAGYLTGRRVLVTGAGGSIGSELCRQIALFEPAELFMLDRDESALHAVELALRGRALLDSPALLLCDIRDEAGLDRAFALAAPDVVFHAAALKHLPLLESHPAEALKTNVWGTLNVLETAKACGVGTFVNISTDKAADPISVLGYSKRIGERLTASAALDTGLGYLSVRFGNVLGSRGSVLTTFHAQIAAGQPVTVTDPDVTRFFMTVEEAVQLVIQAGALGGPGEALVLDMGAPVRIAEVAERMIAESGTDPGIVYTGLRPGEKLSEVLLGCGEIDVRPCHELISHVVVPPLDPAVVEVLDPCWGAGAIIDGLAELAVDGDDAGERVADLA